MLQAPKLDDRSFERLVDEALARIPRYTPEWTNFNDADPGITLVQLHAWLTETILYRLNRLPELTYIKFLDLLNVRPHPAVPARAQLSFTLKRLNKASDALVVLIPKATQVGVDDPDLEEELVFETDRTLRALNASLATILVPNPSDETGAPAWELVTEFDDDERAARIKSAFYPFGPAPGPGDAFLFGLLLRPHRKDDVDYSLDGFPEGELDLAAFVPEVFEEDAEGTTMRGPEGMECLFPWQAANQSEAIVWEVYNGSDHTANFTDDSAWKSLVVHDETASLTQSGHIYLDVPGHIPAVPFDELDRSFWEELNLKKPPIAREELLGDYATGVIDADGLSTIFEAMGLEKPTYNDPESPVEDQIQAAELDFRPADERDEEALAEAWIEAGYDAAPVPYPLHWFRARLDETPERVPQVSRLLLNTVGATAAVTRVEEIVATSNGRPNQSYALRYSPVLVGGRSGVPELALEIDALGEVEEWRPVTDFYRVDRDRAVYLLDSETGTITFGDGEHGRIPVAGADVIARSYRYGGGSVGNVGKGTISNLRSALVDVESVTNLRPAVGGADAETLDEVILRAPHDLRTRERAVTAEDFADLARQTPGVRIQRAYALPLTRADVTATPPSLISDTPGAVTVVVLPENDEDMPQPTEDQLRLVCSHLNRRRLITTELYVVGPTYLTLETLRAEITVRRDADLKAVYSAAVKQLLAYFNPLHGGDDKHGWPFGQDVYFGNVYRQLLGVAGVLRVLCLEIKPESGNDCNDIVPVPDGTLVHLPHDAIDLQVRYDAFS